MFSKFHFTRIFQRLTGVSPGRFLSALRLQQAKRLLESTSLNVADIGMRVGYHSVGTFSARFTRSVGLSPSAYRRLGGFSRQIMLDGAREVASTSTGVVSGRVWAQSPAHPRATVFVGLFPSRVAEGRPIRFTVLDGPGPYRLEKVPAGVWYLLAQSVPNDEDAAATCGPGEQLLYLATHGPVEVADGGTVENADLHLAPMRALDPPLLSAPLGARRTVRRISTSDGSRLAASRSPAA